MAAYRVDIMTLFPETASAVLHESILGRACEKGILEINCVQIRDYTENRQRQVDDYPYGGGWGCVMMAQPLKSCLDAVKRSAEGRRTRVVCLSPQGETFTQDTARRYVTDYDHLVLVCGHYEGIDERFITSCVDEELSLGNFVLTGGEIAAMAVTDCVCRMVPGVLADEECYTGESHWEGLLEYPQYTRPEVWEGLEVPEVLRGGNHADIARWRRKQMLERTARKRPDMFSALTLSPEDAALWAEVQKDAARPKIPQPVDCRPAAPEDLEAIMLIVRQARNYLKKHRVDQWQNGYPDEGTFAADIARGECRVVTCAGRVQAMFTLSPNPEPDYEGLTDGKWRSVPGESAVLHRLAVSAEMRGSGLAALVMSFVEAAAREMGKSALRTDTHKKNRSMQALLRSCGCEYRGNVVLTPESDPQPRQAFEKLL